MVTSIIISTLAVFLIVEGLFLLAFPKVSKIALSYLTKKSTNLRKWGLSEAIIGLLILLIGFSLRN